MRSIYIYLFLLLLVSCQPKCFVSKIVDGGEKVRRITYVPGRTMVYQEDPLVFVKVINGIDTIYGLNLLYTANFKAVKLSPSEEVVFNFHFLNGQTWNRSGILMSQKIPATKKYQLTSKLVISSETFKTLCLLPLAYFEVDGLKVDFSPSIAERLKRQANCLATYW